MPTSTAITASSGSGRRQRLEHGGGMQPAGAVEQGRPARLLGAPALPAAARSRPAASAGRPAQAGRGARRGCGRCRPTAAPRPGGTCRASSGRGRPGSSAPRWRCRCGSRTTRRARAGSRCGPSPPSRPGCPSGRARRTPSGWSSGTSPLALNVVMTGASRCSASASTAPRNGRAPLPTMITGRSAAASSATARSSSACGGAIAVAATRPARGRAGGSVDAVAAPAPRRGRSGGRRRAARWRASWPAPPARWRSSGESTVWLHSATASNAAASGSSWKAPGPTTCVCTWPVSARIGTRSTLASHRPVSRLVAPGPAIEKHAAGRPVSLA